MIVTTALFRVAAATALALAGLAAQAADDPAPPKGDKLAAARALIADNKWAPAIEELKKVGDSGSADWNNLMGYSYRKARTPDFAAAERYYTEALRIDAAHKGALEYSGELYLMLGNLARAEERLAALDKACRASCDEYKALKSAIEQFKANGNRPVARP